VPFGRRGSTTPSEDPQPVAVPPEGGKGRPTPKRSEARQARRKPGSRSSSGSSGSRKEAAATQRQQGRLERQRAMAALRTGDERFLPARDAGPERRFARDFVDSRFTLGQLFFVAIVVALVAGFILGPISTLAAELCNLLGLISLIVILFDSSRHARATKAAVAKKYGADSALGMTSYAFLRAMYPRRFRRPPPKVKRGGEAV
jgi:hypothetical protein